MSTIKNFIGHGIYTLPEAAMYARVHPSSLLRWVFGTRKSGKPVFDCEIKNDEKLITFLDLIQSIAIREARVSKNISLPKIKEAITIAEIAGLNHPFARKNCVFYDRDAKDLLIKRPDDYLIKASGKSKGQGYLPFYAMYLDNLSYDQKGIASEYKVTIDEVPIKMDPEIRFGEPLLPSGNTALLVWNLLKDDMTFEEIEDEYGIKPNEAKASYKFFMTYTSLGRTAA